MAGYHPPKIITNNAAPILAADLAYEAHGKCAQTRVLNADLSNSNNIFNAATENRPNAWKVVFLQESTVNFFHANNLSDGSVTIVENDNVKLGAASNWVKYSAGTEIMADITRLELEVDDLRPEGLCILYMNCTQS